METLLEVKCKNTEYVKLLVAGKGDIPKDYILESKVNPHDLKKCYLVVTCSMPKRNMFEEFVSENGIVVAYNIAFKVESYQYQHSTILLPGKSSYRSIIDNYTLSTLSSLDALPISIFEQLKKWICKCDQIDMQHGVLTSKGVRVYYCSPELHSTSFSLNGTDYVVVKEGYYVQVYNFEGS